MNHTPASDSTPGASGPEPGVVQPQFAAPSFSEGTPEDANPYYARSRGAVPPELDAGAPVFGGGQERRLNRKALLLLGTLFVLVFTILFFIVDTDEAKETTRKPQTTSAPQMPDSMAREDDPAVAKPPEPSANPVRVKEEKSPEPPPLQLAAVDAKTQSTAEEQSKPRKPTLVERRIQGMQGSKSEGDRPATAPASQVGPATTKADAAALLLHPDTLLMRGTYLRCILETRIVTTVDGFASCVLTEPVYSFNGRMQLLPKGTKILGRYKADGTGDRVPVVWDRLVTPTGLNVSMASPGVDNLGGAGIPGDYDAHWGSRIMSALLISLVSDGFQWAASKHAPPQVTTMNGPWGTTVTEQPFESATADSMKRLAHQALSESARRKPTVTVHQGTLINIYVAKDVDFASVLAR